MIKPQLPPPPPPVAVQHYFERIYAGAAEVAAYGNDNLGRIVSAMDQVSTLNVAGQLLKEMNLPFSAAGWRALKDTRLETALQSKQLTEDRILEMLQEMEEHGRQHVLLFQAKPGITLTERLSPRRVRRALTEHDALDAFDSSPPIEAPRETTLTHVRFENDSLVFKALETKEAFIRVQTIPFEHGREIRFERLNRQRRAKVARLHANGLLEVRLSTLNSSRSDHSYAQEAEAFLTTFRWLVEPSWFEPASLKTFKARIWSRSKGDAGIQVLSQDLDSDAGGRVVLKAQNRQTDAAADPGLQASKTALLEREGSSFGKSEVKWEAQVEPGRPRAPVTIRVTNHINEFSVGQALSKADYDYVFEAIRKFGRL